MKMFLTEEGETTLVPIIIWRRLRLGIWLSGFLNVALLIFLSTRMQDQAFARTASMVVRDLAEASQKMSDHYLAQVKGQKAASQAYELALTSEGEISKRHYQDYRRAVRKCQERAEEMRLTAGRISEIAGRLAGQKEAP